MPQLLTAFAFALGRVRVCVGGGVRECTHMWLLEFILSLSL